MSIKHRKEGEVVWKRPGAGFSGTGAYVEIQPAPDDDVPCMICNDPECREWNDTFGLNANTIEEARAIARCINAPVFAQQIVQEAEFFAQQGNHAAVAATLAQAGEYLDEDIAIQALEELQDSPEPRPWESGPFSVSLALQNARGARERLAQTRERH